MSIYYSTCLNRVSPRDFTQQKFNVLFAGSAFHVPIRSCAHSKLTGRIHNNRKDENGDALRFYRNQPLHREEEKADGEG